MLLHDLDLPNFLIYGPHPGDNIACGAHTGSVRIYQRTRRYYPFRRHCLSSLQARVRVHTRSLDWATRAFPWKVSRSYQHSLRLQADSG